LRTAALTANPISSFVLSFTDSFVQLMNASSIWLRFAPVSVRQLVKTPFTKANTFTLSSLEFNGKAAYKDDCWLVRAAVGAGFIDSDKQTLEKCPFFLHL